MIKGLGVDIVENSRFKDLKEGVAKKIFTEREISLSPKAKREEYFASRFASKEAFSKALGTGFTKIQAKEIEILTDESGMPYVARSAKIESLVSNASIHLSISHEKEYSVAVVVIDG